MRELLAEYPIPEKPGCHWIIGTVYPPSPENDNWDTFMFTCRVLEGAILKQCPDADVTKIKYVLKGVAHDRPSGA